MADPTHDDDEQRRRAAYAPRHQGVPAVAESEPDAALGLIVLGLLAGLLAITLPFGVAATVGGDADDSAAAAADDHGDDEPWADEDHGDDEAMADEDHGDDEAMADEEVAAEFTDAELATFRNALRDAGFDGIELEGDGRTLVATGVVPDDAARDGVLATLAGLEGVEEVVDQLTVAAPAEAVATFSDEGILLEGSITSTDVEAQLLAVGGGLYGTADVIDNQLAIDGEAVGQTFRFEGEVSNPELFAGIEAAGAQAESLGATVVNNVTLGGDGAAEGDAEAEEEPTELEAQLAELFALEPIQFETGTAVIVPASLETLEAATEILLQFPDAVLEVQGHTDSRGDEGANQALSQARAEAVVAALVDAGVESELTAVGYGETELLVDPEVTDEDLQANRRIEFVEQT